MSDDTATTRPELVREWTDGETLWTLYECPTCGSMWRTSGQHSAPAACPWDPHHP